MRTSRFFPLVVIAVSLAACGKPDNTRPTQQPVIYEQVQEPAGMEIDSLNSEPVTFSKGNLKVVREDVPMSQVLPDETRNRQRESAKCGTPISAERMGKITQLYAGKSAYAYGLYPADGESDLSLYYVIAVPNLPGYTDKKAVSADFTDSCVAGSMPLITMNAQWLVFAGPACDLPDTQCKSVANLVQPSIKLK
jgi:hypothetical protein